MKIWSIFVAFLENMNFTSTMSIIQLWLPCPKVAISALMFKSFVLPVSTYNYNYGYTHKNIEEKSISVLQQSLSVEVRRSKATMIGHKGHKEAKTRLCTLSCRLYRYLLDCKVGLLALGTDYGRLVGKPPS